jgi:integrase
MSIHPTSSGTYQVRWREYGKQCCETFKRQVDAKKFEASLLLRVQNPLVGHSAVSMLFTELADTWIDRHATVAKTAGSVIRDQQILRDYLRPGFGQAKIKNISTAQIEIFRSQLKRAGKISGKTINNIVGLLHKILSDAVRWRYLIANPAQGIRPIPTQERAISFWTIDEREKFLRWAKINKPQLHDAVSVAVHTGLRRGELDGLLRDSVDFNRKEIIVRRSYCHKTDRLNNFTKSKKVRRVPLNAFAFRILRERALVGMEERILPADYHNISECQLKPACRKAGVSEITFHDLRHSCASHLAMAGVPVIKIKELLGHSDLKTTMRYMHLAPGGLDGVTDVLLSPSQNATPPAESGKNVEVLLSFSERGTDSLSNSESLNGAQGGT